ncbi:F-box/LRR-repeat protein 4 [Daktulosphaira vitifoliae]|uniref:F-box/LRR-repeat protein 4 n=1 Tax=Daktulosphaira vitifoliae TaxID=58002 RepID=UPI0021A9FF0A|nr:F-box/LRR-repeat protein 4 [Daktulosphaira vitifoliae]
MTEEQLGFNLADLKKLCKSYIDYTRTYADQTSQQCHEMDGFVFQFASEVVDFSSQYGSDISISYTASNLTGKPSKFPNYGDFPQSYVMRSYGPWKEHSPSRKCSIMPQNAGKIKSEDFIILSFDIPVIPMVVSIFETYTPGSVIRISGKVVDQPETKAWKLLWEGMPQNCNGIRQSRLFSPQIKFIGERIKQICIEFNHTQLDYYTELDAVSLGGIVNNPEDGIINVKRLPITPTLSGYIFDDNQHASEVSVSSILPKIPVSTSLDPFIKLIKNIEELEIECRKAPNFDLISQLPDETLMLIFSFLDLKSLRRCMAVCKRFNDICKDEFLYTEINLKPYWSSFSYLMLTSLEPYCTRLTKLDLSWCGITNGISSTEFNLFIKKCGNNFTNLRLDSCGFVKCTVLTAISLYCPNLKELSLRNCTSIEFEFNCMLSFPKIERFDFYRTNITVKALESILCCTPYLKHINLGSCKKIETMDRVAFTLAFWNTDLVSVDFWKSYTLSPSGLRYLTACSKLEEIDLGWCLGLSIPGDSLVSLAKACPSLKKIIIVSLRGVCDRDLLAFSNNCPLLEQIDLVGLRAITADACSRFLQNCKHLKLMDVNFCENIKEMNILDWRLNYPHVCIKYTTSNHTNVYHY